jgi:hypothetical protein
MEQNPNVVKASFTARVERLSKQLVQDTPMKALLTSNNQQLIELDGPGYLTIIETYVEAFNTGRVPTIADAADLVVQRQLERSIKDSLATYTSIMDKVLVCDMVILLEFF